MSFLKVEKISHHYDNKPVLHDISFSLAPNEILSILGPSGCGKSTLLKIITGLIQPANGKIYLENRDITDLPPQKREIGIVFQSYALFPNLNVFANIAFGLKMKKFNKQVIQERTLEMLNLIDLREKAYCLPHQLSGGEQQRVALARALAPYPRLLLLDEPLSALDAKIRKNLRLELRKIIKAAGATSIFVTHDQEEAMLISDRILVMNEGKIEQEGTPEEIYTHPRNLFVAGFIGNYNLFSPADIGEIGRQKLENTFYAVRPETINIYPCHEGKEAFPLHPHSIICKGKITDVNMSGNIVVYSIAVGSSLIRVDKLNQAGYEYLKPGTRVIVEIPYQALHKVG
ncbi:putative spermidine/putrescine transport system ATP-binding protein [Thermosyntropha lipolytica DSM 11003]|uniref:ABC-type quaternary amine transporter n=1 Tax=Thermosyntropha lipolytica DSM 11003 TaxID=1123382 RepID=A0A1M5LYV2_9FIRM|nr:ABC transporter ATP-binding protein [Thermosyntropha lipolytica]SHG69573.1 putative spermidine/putrescine transport system ATP-binding protein [Thermosyntropha lipolytica DSM 11003]